MKHEQRLDSLEERLARLPVWAVFAFVLLVTELEDWIAATLTRLGAVDLGGGRHAVLLGGDVATQRQAVKRLRQDMETAEGDGLRVLRFRSVSSRGILALVWGRWRELYLVGPRGEGKTFDGLAGWALFGHSHRRAGFPAPARVMAFADTFASQKLKLLRSALAPEWGGLWRAKDDGHVLEAVLQGEVLATLDVFGVEDMGAVDRLRMEATGAWLEEPAPAAVGETSSGVSEDALSVALTSLRLASYAHPTLVSSNYPDSNHWSWRRYMGRPQPGTLALRIPPGERVSAEQRAEWAEGLASRPDLRRRLLDGEPGIVVVGVGVTQDAFNPALHVAPERLRPTPGVPLVIGHDAGLTPTSVILDQNGPFVRILAALTSERAGTLQHIQTLLRPWLARHAPEAQLVHFCDPSMFTPSQADIGTSPAAILRRELGGPVREGPTAWPPRRDAVLGLLGTLVNGRPAFVIDPGEETALLREALAGRWHYAKDRAGIVMRELPEKDHPWSDLGDALAYAVVGARPWRAQDRGPVRPYLARTEFNALTHNRPSRVRTHTTLPWYRPNG